MIVKLLTGHRLEFLSLTGGCTGSSVKKLSCHGSIGSRISLFCYISKMHFSNAYIAVQTIARFIHNGLTYNVCHIIRLENHYV